MPWSNDSVLDAALDKIATANLQLICNDIPTTRAAAVSMALADVAMAGGDFTKADGDTSGRKTTVAAKSSITVDTQGTHVCYALVDATDLLYVRDPDPVNSGTAQAGAAGSITLAAGASANDDEYNGRAVKITSGTGSGQHRPISDYNGTTKVATVSANWDTTPDATSVYEVIGQLLTSGNTVSIPAGDIEIADPT